MVHVRPTRAYAIIETEEDFSAKPLAGGGETAIAVAAMRDLDRRADARYDYSLPNVVRNAATDRARRVDVGTESRVRESNPRPHDYKSSALPTELTRRDRTNANGPQSSLQHTSSPVTMIR